MWSLKLEPTHSLHYLPIVCFDRSVWIWQDQLDWSLHRRPIWSYHLLYLIPCLISTSIIDGLSLCLSDDLDQPREDVTSTYLDRMRCLTITSALHELFGAHLRASHVSLMSSSHPMQSQSVDQTIGVRTHHIRIECLILMTYWDWGPILSSAITHLLTSNTHKKCFTTASKKLCLRPVCQRWSGSTVLYYDWSDRRRFSQVGHSSWTDAVWENDPSLFFWRMAPTYCRSIPNSLRQSNLRWFYVLTAFDKELDEWLSLSLWSVGHPYSLYICISFLALLDGLGWFEVWSRLGSWFITPLPLDSPLINILSTWIFVLQ